MKKLAVLLIVSILTLTSCRSGWSCKKRYVENAVKENTNNNIKNS